MHAVVLSIPALTHREDEFGSLYHFEESSVFPELADNRGKVALSCTIKHMKPTLEGDAEITE